MNKIVQKSNNWYGASLKIVQTHYDQGYIFPHYEYSVYVNGKLLAKKVGSIKTCYLKAYNFIQGYK